MGACGEEYHVEVFSLSRAFPLAGLRPLRETHLLPTSFLISIYLLGWHASGFSSFSQNIYKAS